MQGGEEGPLALSGPLEVAWCRRFLERSEREYNAMVDGLLGENEQLADLVLLLAQQLEDRGAGEGRLLAAVQELVDSSSGELRRQREECQQLQQSLRAEQLQSQTLQRRLEEALRELPCSPSNAGRDVAPGTPQHGGAGLPRSAAEEAKRRERAEARCGLVERRCEEEVARLEGELQALRQGGDVPVEVASRQSWSPRPWATSPTSRGLSGRPGALDRARSPAWANSPGGAESPTRTGREAKALKVQLDKERALHRQHLALYKRHLTELAAACGRSLPPELQTEGALAVGVLPLELSASRAGSRRLSPACSRDLTPPSKTGTPRGGGGGLSDDEDYVWEGYLERPAATSPGAFEKVYLELTLAGLRVLPYRSSSEVLVFLPLGSLAGPAEIAGAGTRIFEVQPLGAAGPIAFRCMSERRAQQWVTAISRAWRRAGRPPGRDGEL